MVLGYQVPGGVLRGPCPETKHIHNKPSMKDIQSQHHLEPKCERQSCHVCIAETTTRRPASYWSEEKGHLLKSSPEQRGAFWTTLQNPLKTDLYQTDQVQEKLLGVLLSVGGKFWVAFAHEGLEHARRDPILLRLQYKDKIILRS